MALSADELAEVQYALQRTMDSVRYPALPMLTEGLEELASWLSDDRQWLGGEARHWKSLLTDILAALEGCGPAFRTFLSAKHDWAIRDLADSRSELERSKGRPPDQAVRRRLELAGTALNEVILEKSALGAGWNDLKAENGDDRRSANARWVLTLAKWQGHDSAGLQRRLSGILADDPWKQAITKHAVTDADDLLDGCLGLPLPSLHPARVIRPDGVWAIQRPLLQRDQHDVRITQRQDAIKVPMRVRVPEFAHDLDVLLGHRG